jgi:hypothetical protein
VVEATHHGVGGGARDNTTREHVHIHDGERHVTGVRSAVVQSGVAGNCCPLANDGGGAEVWDNQHLQRILARNAFGTFRW